MAPIKKVGTAKLAPKTATEKVAVKKKVKKKESASRLVSPVGRFSYPHLAEPNTEGQYPTNKYQTDFLVKKADMVTPAGKALMDLLCKAATEKFGELYESIDEIPVCAIMDMDEKGDVDPDMAGCYRIRAKNKNKPVVFNAQKERMTDEQIAEIKGGDYGRIVVSAWASANGEGSANFNLDTLQFWKTGDPIGSTAGSAVELLDEMEVPLEEMEEATEESTEEEGGVDFD